MYVYMYVCDVCVCVFKPKVKSAEYAHATDSPEGIVHTQIYVYVCIYMRMYVHVHRHKFHRYVYPRTLRAASKLYETLHAHSRTYIHTYIHTYTHMYMYIDTCRHTQVYIHIHTHKHTYIHTYIQPDIIGPGIAHMHVSQNFSTSARHSHLSGAFRRAVDVCLQAHHARITRTRPSGLNEHTRHINVDQRSDDSLAHQDNSSQLPKCRLVRASAVESACIDAKYHQPCTIRVAEWTPSELLRIVKNEALGNLSHVDNSLCPSVLLPGDGVAAGIAGVAGLAGFAGVGGLAGFAGDVLVEVTCFADNSVHVVSNDGKFLSRCVTFRIACMHAESRW